MEKSPRESEICSGRAEGMEIRGQESFVKNWQALMSDQRGEGGEEEAGR